MNQCDHWISQHIFARFAYNALVSFAGNASPDETYELFTEKTEILITFRILKTSETSYYLIATIYQRQPPDKVINSM